MSSLNYVVGLILVVTASFPLAAASDRSNGPSRDARRFGGHTYEFISTPLTWHKAVDYCRDRGGYLAAIESDREQDFIYRLAKDSTQVSSIWVGGTDEDSEGDWQWVTGEAIRWSKWDSGRPNNRAGEEHHIHMRLDSGKWHDTNAGLRTHFVCEWNQ